MDTTDKNIALMLCLFNPVFVFSFIKVTVYLVLKY